MVCFPNSFGLLSVPSVILVMVVGIVIALAVYSVRNSAHHTNMIFQELHKPQNNPIAINVKGGDDRYSRSPEAERVWDTPPDYSRIPSSEAPFNIPTQGVPESYQSMGIVKTADGKLLPLYGRRTIGKRERYNYYSRTDSYNPLPIPINMEGRDCQDQVGCPELFNGDKVGLSATGQTGEVVIYRVRDIVR